MQKPKLDVFVAFLTFGGNGSVSTIIPSHSDWLAETALKAKADDRVGRFDWGRFGDIPLDVERNKIVQYAKDKGYDVLIMLDSDNFVDKYVGSDPNAKPFWDSSFDFLYERYLRQVPTVVCCPYCGPPPDDVKGGMENVYVFYFSDLETADKDAPRSGIQLSPYAREHAAMMRGIQPIGAGPTGAIMYSMDAFDLFPPMVNKQLVLDEYKDGKITGERAIQLMNRQGWFFYETNQNRTKKESTEDVTNTREIQLAGMVKYGCPVVFCNWDAWAGHWKPKCVGKPRVMPIEAVSEMFQEAVRNNVSVDTRAVDLNFGSDFDFSDTPIMESDAPEPPKVEPEGHSEVILGLKFEGVSGDKDSILAIHQSLPDGQNHEKILVVGASAARVAWACAYKRPYATVYYCDKEGSMPLIPDRTHGQLMRLERVPELYPGAFDRIVCASGATEVIESWLCSPSVNRTCELVTTLGFQEARELFSSIAPHGKIDGSVYEESPGNRVHIHDNWVNMSSCVTIIYGVPSP